ncbi:MAG: SURF1 family protein [Pseudomonadota bacterium]
MTPHRSRLKRVGAAALVLFLFVAFCALGTWQLQRRTWKLDLIAHTEEQLAKPPTLAPGPEEWPAISSEQVYQPVSVTGVFLHDRESLVQAMTKLGSGYWVITPLQTEQGFLVLVNRGFVDQAHRDQGTRIDTSASGKVQVTGLLRLTEPDGRLFQANDPVASRWYSRDVQAMGAAHGLASDSLAPYFIDVGVGSAEQEWPVGGLTVIQFRNTHLGYALTWYALAAMTVWGAWRLLREP